MNSSINLKILKLFSMGMPRKEISRIAGVKYHKVYSLTAEDRTAFMPKKYREMAKLGCFTCTSSQDIQIHHRDKNRKNNNIINLIPLCKECHASIHYRHKKYDFMGYKITKYNGDFLLDMVKKYGYQINGTLGLLARIVKKYKKMGGIIKPYTHSPQARVDKLDKA